MKYDETRKTGFQFKSKTKRFDENEHKVIKGKISPFNILESMPNKPMLFRENSQSTYDSSFSNKKGKSTLMNQYMKSLQAPFNSISPRFNYTKKSIEGMQMPGPGAYSVVHQKSPSHLEKSAAFRASSRDKDSLFGKIVRRPNGDPGPGAYNNSSSLIKKTFNAGFVK